MVKILLILFLLVCSIAAQTVTIDVNTNRQTVLSWAAGSDVGCLDYPVSCPDWIDTLMDDAVAAGLNGVHVAHQVAEYEDATDAFQIWIDTNADYPHANRTAWITNNGNPTNDDGDPDVETGSGFVTGRLSYDCTNVLTPLRQRMASRGESLYISLVLSHTSLSNQFFVDDPDEYGELVKVVWDKWTSVCGYVPSALEIMGEPDHGDRQVTPTELVAMLNAARTRLVAAGYSEPLFIIPGNVSCPAARQYYLDMKTANATAAGYADILSHHRYVNCDDISLGNFWTTANNDGKLGLAMTEYDSNYDLPDIWQDMEVGKSVLTAGISFGYPGSTPNSAYFYISGTLGSGPYTVNKDPRVKYMQHFWKYVRRGAVGKGVTNSLSTCKGLPYRNTNGTYAVVLRATGAVTCTVENLPPATYGRRRTQGDGTSAPSSHDTDLGNATVTTTEDVTFTFTAAGIGTIYDVNYLQSANPAKVKMKGVKVKGVKL